jgi:hypothetical protein
MDDEKKGDKEELKVYDNEEKELERGMMVIMIMTWMMTVVIMFVTWTSGPGIKLP